MATFNILSSCICRDAFGLRENNEHEIIHFFQSSSPITWFELNDKPKQKMTMEHFSNVSVLSNFQRKCIINDYNKTVLDSFTEKSDFFITDLVSFACTAIGKQRYSDNSVHYFTFSKWFRIAYTEGLNNSLEGKFETINRFKLIDDAFIKKTVENYIKWIKSKGYTSREIILVENKKVNSYSDGELFYYFDYEKSREIKNNILDKIYAEFERQLPDCYIIKMPHGVYADKNHIWGLIDLHYCKEYYDYLYECFDMISKHSDCRGAIEQLREQYSKILIRNRDTYITNSFRYIHGKQLLDKLIFIENFQSYIAPKNASYYSLTDISINIGKLKKYIPVERFNKIYSKITLNKEIYLVSNDEIIRGASGNDCKLGSWKTVNAGTLVIFKDDSILLGHNNCSSRAQMQVIQSISEIDLLAGKVITLTVWARVLKPNNDNSGGTIAIINACDYNKGKFYASKEFNNREWKQIKLTTRLPEKDGLKGVTVCLRSMAGTGDNPEHALVEFCNPKLEFGSFGTGYFDY